MGTAGPQPRAPDLSRPAVPAEISGSGILCHSFWHYIWHLFWHSFWYSSWHIVWHSIWHSIWHSTWHTFWNSVWHSIWQSLAAVRVQAGQSLRLAVYGLRISSYTVRASTSRRIRFGPSPAHSLWSWQHSSGTAWHRLDEDKARRADEGKWVEMGRGHEGRRRGGGRRTRKIEEEEKEKQKGNFVRI